MSSEKYKRVVENMQETPVEILRYVLLSKVNKDRAKEVYEQYKPVIDEFVDIYGIKDDESWQDKLFDELIRYRDITPEKHIERLRMLRRRTSSKSF